MKIGILAAGITPDALLGEFPSYANMFAQQLGERHEDFSFSTYDVRLGEFPHDSQECDAWLITGSKADAYADEPWILRLCDLIREIHQTQQTLVGICFGHQVIARALGGRVEKYHGGWGVGVHHYEVCGSEPILPEGQTLALCAFHQDQVVEKPEGAEVFLRSPFCENAGLLYGDHILSFQAHPEFSKVYEAALINLYDGKTLSPDEAKKALVSLEGADVHSQAMMTWIGNFLHQAR